MKNLIYNGVLSLFFPQQCRTCGRYLKDFKYEYVCKKCFGQLAEINDLSCNICGKPLSSDVETCLECKKRNNSFDFCRPAGIYEGALKDMIYALKFDKKKKAARVIGEYICEKTSLTSLNNDFILVPVPANNFSVKERGFCHTTAIACVIASKTGHTVVNAVEKIRETAPQNKLKKKKRLTNLKGAFSVVKDVSGKKVVVLDDVYTTGSTMNEMAKVLVEAGAVSVIGIVAARSV